MREEKNWHGQFYRYQNPAATMVCMCLSMSIAVCLCMYMQDICLSYICKYRSWNIKEVGLLNVDTETGHRINR